MKKKKRTGLCVSERDGKQGASRCVEKSPYSISSAFGCGFNSHAHTVFDRSPLHFVPRCLIITCLFMNVKGGRKGHRYSGKLVS